MITVTAMQRARAGQLDQLDALMATLASDIQANEPGCLRFDYVVSDSDPTHRLVYEQYRDWIAFEYHKSTPYLQEFLPSLLECLHAPPEVTTYGEVSATALPPSFFHIGMIVPDLEKAVNYYSDLLGIRFTEPGTFDIPRLEDPDPHPFKLTAVLSMTQPPYYELIQAEGDGICSVTNAGQILYYGCYESDMPGRVNKLRSQGIGIAALFRMDAESAPFSLITAPDAFGARYEYVGVDSMGPMDEWVRTGKLPVGIGA